MPSRAHKLRAVALALAATAVFVLVAVSASTALAATTGLWVTQRQAAATSNVAAFTFNLADDALSLPSFAGAGGAGSFGIAITPDGAHLYVTNDNSENSLSQYSVDPNTGVLTDVTPATVAVSVASNSSNPEDIAVDPSGRWVYSANPDGPSLSQLRINPATGALTLVAEFTMTAGPPALVLTFPTGVAFSPDGHSLYVADYGGGDIAEFDVNPLTGAITPKSTPEATLPASGTTPRRIVTADVGGNDYAYVSDSTNNEVVEFAIDPSSGELSEVGEVGADSGPTGLAVDTASSPASLYVAAEEGDVVDEYDISATNGELTAKTPASLPTGSGPDGLALAPDNNELYVGNSDSGFLSLYDVAADGVLTVDSAVSTTDGGVGTVDAGSGPSTPLVHALPAPSTTPPAPLAGALTQLPAPNDCVTGNAFGCNTLTSPSLGADYQTIVSPDGSSVYAAAYLGVLTEFTRNPADGSLTESGCVTNNSSGCTSNNVAGTNNPRAIALSGDGDYLYAVTADNALVGFARNPSDGALTWLQCFSSTDSNCTPAPGLDAPNGVAVSGDGMSVYVTSGGDSAITEFGRDPANGLLTQLPAPNDCLSSDPSNPGGCAVDTATGLANAVGVVVSADSRNVYVSAGGLGPGDVAEFSRNLSTGALTQLPSPNDCLTSAATVITCGNSSAVGFNGEEDIAISPDGHSVYLNSFADSAIIELSRDATTGVLTQLPTANDCISSDLANPGGCGNDSAVALNSIQGVAVSPDGLNVYAAASGPPTAATGANDAVDEFTRNPLTGVLTQMAAPADCLTENGSGCSTYNANGLGSPRRLVVSADGRNVYVAGQEGTLVELARTPPSAALALSESGAPANATPGSDITYNYTVSDNGPSDTDGITFSTTLANAETLVAVTSAQGSCSGTSTISCVFGPLLAGTSVSISITVALLTTGVATDVAAVSNIGDVTDPDAANSSTTTTTTITPVPAPITPVPAPITLLPILPLTPLTLKPPVLRQSADLSPVSGSVMVRLAGSATFVPLSTATNVPTGSTINADEGTISLTTTLPNGSTQTGQFYDGEFVLTQSANGTVILTLAGGSFTGCPAPAKDKSANALSASVHKKPTTVIRQLWGNAHGDYTTKGRYGSAAVSGTVWLTQDRCDGTFVRVTRDNVIVVAYAHPKKKHNVKQGRHLLVPAPSV